MESVRWPGSVCWAGTWPCVLTVNLVAKSVENRRQVVDDVAQRRRLICVSKRAG